uniref:Uncharacterized protein n=1 Tax=Ixodes ricinus TaxID=34613 RepID=A0A6B0V2V4_IXORI
MCFGCLFFSFSIGFFAWPIFWGFFFTLCLLFLECDEFRLRPSLNWQVLRCLRQQLALLSNLTPALRRGQAGVGRASCVIIQFLYSHQTLIAVHFFRCLAGFVAGSGKEWKCLSFFFASGRVGQLGFFKLIARLWAICSGKLGCLVAGGCTLGQRNNRCLRCGMCKKRYLFERMNNLCAYNLVGLINAMFVLGSAFRSYRDKLNLSLL